MNTLLHICKVKNSKTKHSSLWYLEQIVSWVIQRPALRMTGLESLFYLISKHYTWSPSLMYRVVEGGDHFRRVLVWQGCQAGQNEVQRARLQTHASQQHPVVCGERRGFQKTLQHLEGHGGQGAANPRPNNVSCNNDMNRLTLRPGEARQGEDLSVSLQVFLVVAKPIENPQRLTNHARIMATTLSSYLVIIRCINPKIYMTAG